MTSQEYWKARKGPKTWLINTILDGREIEFIVVVAEDESEIDDLVAFTLAHLKSQNG